MIPLGSRPAHIAILVISTRPQSFSFCSLLEAIYQQLIRLAGFLISAYYLLHLQRHAHTVSFFCMEWLTCKPNLGRLGDILHPKTCHQLEVQASWRA
jgi:hypothetical protein